MHALSRLAVPAIAPLAWVWIGLLLGVSFFATPIKFQAASLARPVAFEVTGVTFAAFNRIEIGLALVLLALVIVNGRRAIGGLAAVVAALVATQTLWLLPDLLHRVALVQEGQALPPSTVHAFYSGAEIAKVLALAAVAVLSSRTCAPVSIPRLDKAAPAGSAPGRS